MNRFSWTDLEVRTALGLPDGDEALAYGGVSTDTRSVGAGDLFVALRGERFDGHQFLRTAADAGATGAIVDRVPQGAPQALAYYIVEDTLRALGMLARHRRRLHAGRVVGIVGSNGKTTTKDLVRAALETRYRTHATRGNLNNQIGVPLTLLAAPDEAEALVIEMGTNEPGEIGILTDIVIPDAAIVTSIGEEHLEKLGSLAGVLDEEISILRGLDDHGLALVAEVPPALPDRARARLGAHRVRVAGFSENADLRPEGDVEVGSDGSTRWSWRGIDIDLPLPGRWNVRNALLALGLAEAWGVPAEDAARGIMNVPRPSMRGEWLEIGSYRVLADCYNSNPPSAAAAIELIADLPVEVPRVVVLGTMRELGESSAELHRRTAEIAASRISNGIDLIVATGDFVPAFAALAAEGDERIIRVEDPIEAFRAAAPRLRGDETILLKASRGEALERWLTLLETNRPDGRP